MARRESSATSDRQGWQNHIERDALRGQTFTFKFTIQNAYARARTEFRAEMLGVLEGFLSQEDAEKDPEYALFNQLYQMAMTAGRKSDIFIHVQGISENEVVLRVYQRFELESGETIYYAGGEFSYTLDENFGKIYRYEI